MESDLACQSQREKTIWLTRCATASVKSEIEVIGRMVTSVPQEVQGIFFSDLFSCGKFVVFWKRILSEHLRKGFYPVLFTPILAKILEEQERKQICLIHT